jgi:1-acyl-sn-glycerol-3-phosphate acyltransferase
LNPGRDRVVYLEEVPVEGLTQEDVPVLKQKVYQLMDKKLREYKVSWIRS